MIIDTIFRPKRTDTVFATLYATDDVTRIAIDSVVFAALGPLASDHSDAIADATWAAVYEAIRARTAEVIS